jgi:hypothetical protein
MTGHPPFLHPVVVGWGACRVGLGQRGGRGRGRAPVDARRRPCGAMLWSCTCDGPLPRAGEQLDVDCILLLGGVAGAGSGRGLMPRSQWRLAIGGHPHRRPPRRRASPAPFFLANCGGLSVGWVSCRT